MKLGAKFVLVLAFALFNATGLEAQVRTWVSGTGIDNATCGRTNPCRNFAAAIAAVNPGGEVVVLDSAGYGPVTIDKSVSIIAPPGVHAAIAPTSGAAINVTAGSSDKVILRGLYLNSQGAIFGVFFFSGSLLFCENLVVAGFFSDGISLFNPVFSRTHISDSIVRMNSTGIRVEGPGEVTIHRCQLLESAAAGLRVSNNVELSLSESLSSGNSNGVHAVALSSFTQSPSVYIDRCSLVSNGFAGIQTELGLQVASTVTVRVSNSVITHNQFGVVHSTGGSILSRGDNTLEGNSTDNAFTGTFGAE